MAVASPRYFSRCSNSPIADRVVSYSGCPNELWPTKTLLSVWTSRAYPDDEVKTVTDLNSPQQDEEPWGNTHLAALALSRISASNSGDVSVRKPQGIRLAECP